MILSHSLNKYPLFPIVQAPHPPLPLSPSGTASSPCSFRTVWEEQRRPWCSSTPRQLLTMRTRLSFLSCELGGEFCCIFCVVISILGEILLHFFVLLFLFGWKFVAFFVISIWGKFGYIFCYYLYFWGNFVAFFCVIIYIFGKILLHFLC